MKKFNHKKIIILGGTGFIGFHLAKALIKKKWKVISVSRFRPRKIRYLKEVTYIYSDLSNLEHLNKKIKNFLDTQYIINASGEVNHNNKKKVLESHYYGVRNIVEIFQKNKNFKRFIQIGSSLEYGKLKSPHKEINKTKSFSYYSSAKIKSSNFLINQFKKKNFPVLILRPYQLYGTHQDSNRLIPFTISNCLKNKKFPCSQGFQIRDFLYIDDFVKVIIKMLSKKKRCIGEIFNIGYGTPCTVKKVINLINKITNKGYPKFGKIKLRKDESPESYPDISKVKKMFLWKPEINLKKGLKITINFYKKINIL